MDERAPASQGSRQEDLMRRILMWCGAALLAGCYVGPPRYGYVRTRPVYVAPAPPPPVYAPPPVVVAPPPPVYVPPPVVEAPPAYVELEAYEPQPVYYEAPPPPAPRYEVRPPAPFFGAIWVDGWWDWRGHRWVWIGGRWQSPRSGYVYAPPRYDYTGGRVTVIRPHWRGVSAPPIAPVGRPVA